MSVSIQPFVAGRYTVAYNSADCGITNEGIELQQESAWEAIDRSDAYGDSIIDGVYRGGNVYFGFEAKSFTSNSVNPFWPWGPLGQMQGTNMIGELASFLSSTLYLAAVTGTAWNNTGGDMASQIVSIQASYAILAPNIPQRLLFHSRLRQVPIRLLALPYTNSGTTVWFTVVSAS